MSRSSATNTILLLGKIPAANIDDGLRPDGGVTKLGDADGAQANDAFERVAFQVPPPPKSMSVAGTTDGVGNL